MPTIVIGQRPDRTDQTVTVMINAGGTERKIKMERAKQYVVGKEVLGVLEHSHEAPYVRVLDPDSKEPTAADLPPPAPSAQASELARTLGKKAKADLPA